MIEGITRCYVIGVWISHTCLDPHITGVSSVWLYEESRHDIADAEYIKLASSI